MSDTFVEDVVLEDPIEVDGQVEEVDGAEEVAENNLPLLNVDEFGNHRVTVKVDGEELAVPLSEAIAGFQRHADYTRKTQELAEQRAELGFGAALKAALDHDPAGTLELLRANYGITPQQAAQQEDDPFNFGNEDDAWTDPATGRLSDIEQRLQRFEQAQAQADLTRTIATLSDKYGELFDPQEVVTEALRTGSTDLEDTFKRIAFDRVVAAQKQATATAAAKAVKTEAKRTAAVVAGGSAAGSGPSDYGPITSITDAWNAAKRQMAS